MTYRNVVLDPKCREKRDRSHQTHNLSSLLCGYISHYAGLAEKAHCRLPPEFFFPRGSSYQYSHEIPIFVLATRTGKGKRAKGGRTAWKIGRHSSEFEGVSPNGCPRINNSWRFRGTRRGLAARGKKNDEVLFGRDDVARTDRRQKSVKE